MVQTWYIVGMILLGLWYVITAFVLQPWLVLRRLMKELEDAEFRGLFVGYLVAMLNEPIPLGKDKDGKTQTAPLFNVIMAQAGDYIIHRGEQWLLAQKSAILRNMDKAALESNPLFMLAGKALPKKYKDFAPLIPELLARFAPKTAIGDENPPSSSSKNRFI